MALVVVGGHTRNIGKTTLATQVLAGLRDLRWTAIKITQYGHSICSANGRPCDCSSGDHAVAVSEERSTTSGKDTARMLAAGARRVLWVRTQQGALHGAIRRIQQEIDGAENILLESNSVLRFVRPDLYLAVLQPSMQDFKASSLRYLDRADAFFMPEGSRELRANVWTGVPARLVQRKPVFSLHETALAPEAYEWVVRRLSAGKQGQPAPRLGAAT